MSQPLLLVIRMFKQDASSDDFLLKIAMNGFFFITNGYSRHKKGLTRALEKLYVVKPLKFYRSLILFVFLN